MSGKYSGLPKVDMSGMKPTEIYKGIKIYLVAGGQHETISAGYAVVGRNHLIDEQLDSLFGARNSVEQFLIN